MKYILYIPGYQSSGQLSESMMQFETHYSNEYKIISLVYDDFNTELAEIQLIDQIKYFVDRSNTVILVGQSLGGYWANQMANKFGITSILINPAIDTESALMNCHRLFDHFVDKPIIGHFKEPVAGVYDKLVILSENDEIADPWLSQQMFKSSAKICILPGATHLLNLKDWYSIHNHISTLLMHQYA